MDISVACGICGLKQSQADAWLSLLVLILDSVFVFKAFEFVYLDVYISIYLPQKGY